MEDDIYLYERENHQYSKTGLTRIADKVLDRETADRVWEAGLWLENSTFPGWITGYVVESDGEFYVSERPNLKGDPLKSQDFDTAFNRTVEELAEIKYDWFNEEDSLELESENFEIGYADYQDIKRI